MFELFLVDDEPDLIVAWKEAFQLFPEVKILEEDILTVADNTIVSPANSYGFMDGGIDQSYIEYFSISLQNKVIDNILRLTDQRLEVGASLIVSTDHPRIPYLIVAPTMILPEVVEAINCFKAMLALLKIASKNPTTIKRVFCPGLATGTGRVPFPAAATEMANAYSIWKKRYN